MGGEMMIFDAKHGADAKDAEIKELREENKKLSRALADANVRAERAQEDAERALTALRRQLTPLYRALQAVFGELDAAGIGDDAGIGAVEPGNVSGRKDLALWADWKAKLPSACSRVIDVLLLHNDMTVRQIMAAAKMGENTVYQATSKMGQLKLIEKNGGRFSLKQLS